ncbi:hypothetical protein [Photobacterium indicum]|uniref:Uncharacterized protein n=1 Tax=Photobacterium indicum TaxID=81447 RepID=A0A2T3LCR7_9GAMM|nr:hypothetical protein [Photobacterium indicum]PSV49182.1 hypothetical protein C9J47_01005 [Photobacterium indicum]
MFKKSIIATTMLLASSTVFAADIDNTNLDISFQGAHFQGAGNQISMLRVPVTNKETGKTQFFDMSAQFAADKNGNLIFKKMSSVKSVAFASANQLVAGHYIDTSGRSWYVDGPSAGADGRLVWVIQMPYVSGTSYNAQVMSGSFSENELTKGLSGSDKLAKKASALNYGVIGGDDIASAAQSGKMISLVRYSSKGVPDRNWTLRMTPEPEKED